MKVKEIKNNVAVLKSERKTVTSYEVEREGQAYILNVIAKKPDTERYIMGFNVIITAPNSEDIRACKWDKVLIGLEEIPHNYKDIKEIADWLIEYHASEIIDFFEEQTKDMYSYKRVVRDMKFWAEYCEKNGFNLTEDTFISQTNHIKNEQELREIREFVESLEYVDDPIAHYEEWVEKTDED